MAATLRGYRMDGDGGGGALIEGRTEALKVGENDAFLKTNEVKKKQIF